MIGPTGAVRVMVATKPVDFRKGAEDWQHWCARQWLRIHSSREVYAFKAKRADRIKLIP